jgi:hypothetical protein
LGDGLGTGEWYVCLSVCCVLALLSWIYDFSTPSISLQRTACKTETTSIHSKESDLDTTFREPDTIPQTQATNQTMSLQSESKLDNAPLCPDEWNSQVSYTTGDRVTLPSTMQIYECKEQPYGYYCAHEAYEVGLEGGIYENAWKVIGKCIKGRVVEDRHYLDGKDHSVDDVETTVYESNIVRPTAIIDPETMSQGTDTDVESELPQNINVPEAFQSPTKCNLCLPGQIGINADIPMNDNVVKCIDIYEYYLQNYLEGTKQCLAAQNWLNGVCCGEKQVQDSAVESSSATSSTTALTAPPTSRPTTDPTFALVQDDTDESSLASIYFEENSLPDCVAPYDANDTTYTLNDRVSHSGGNYVCMMTNWCSQSDFEPRIGQYWMVVWEYDGACRESSVDVPQRPIDLANDGASFIDVSEDEQQQPPPLPPTEPVEVETTQEPTELAEVETTQIATEPAEVETTQVATEPEEVETTQEPTEPEVETTQVATEPAEVETTQEPTEVESIQEATEPAASEALVDSGEPECPSSWKLDNDYAEGDTVGAKGQIYTCKPFPYNGKFLFCL